MNIIDQSTARVIKATRPPKTIRFSPVGKGIVTMEVHVPLYVWAELATHRRASRNGASARAMGKTYHKVGYYKPRVFYAQGERMKAGEPLNKIRQSAARLIWLVAIECSLLSMYLLERLGVAKEQRNRLAPHAKMIRGMVSMTESGWKSFLVLRDSPEADVAMQEFATAVRVALEEAIWTESPYHTPYHEGSMVEAVARFARVSYNLDGGGRRPQQLVQDLMQPSSGPPHTSPFEHIARWDHNPVGNFATLDEDTDTVNGRRYGWCQLRHNLDEVNKPESWGYSR